MQLAKGTTEKMWRKALGITAVLVFLGFGAVVRQASGGSFLDKLWSTVVSWFA